MVIDYYFTRLKLPYCILGKLIITGIQIILNNMIVVDLGRYISEKPKKQKRCCRRDVPKKANILSFKSFGIVMVLTGTVLELK